MTQTMGSELLQGERVYLDAITRDDLPRYVAWFTDLELARLVNPGIMFPMTVEAIRAYSRSHKMATDGARGLNPLSLVY